MKIQVTCEARCDLGLNEGINFLYVVNKLLLLLLEDRVWNRGLAELSLLEVVVTRGCQRYWEDGAEDCVVASVTSIVPDLCQLGFNLNCCLSCRCVCDLFLSATPNFSGKIAKSCVDDDNYTFGGMPVH